MNTFIEETTIIDKIKTKNGYHIVTTPFEYPLLYPEMKGRINSDGMILIYFLPTN